MGSHGQSASMAPWAALTLAVAFWVGVAPPRAHAHQSDVPEISADLHQGRFQEALTRSTSALASHPGDCRVLSLQALAYMGLQQPQEARRSFGQALAKCPAYLPALEGAAQIEFSRRRPGAGLLLKRILAIQPGNVSAHAMLATVLASSGQCSDALAHYAAAQSLFARQPELAQAYATCLTRTGDTAGALQQLETIAAAQPTDANRYNVAVIQWKMRRGQAALSTLQPLLDAGRFGPAFDLAARVSEATNDTPRAVQLLRTAIEIDPDDIENYLDFVTVAFNHNSFQVGIDVLDAGLRRLPSSAQLYLARGVLEAQISKQDDAVRDFQEAHKLDPKLSLSADALGIMQTQQHESAASLAFFREQAVLHPKDPILQYLLAEQLAQGDGAAGADLVGAIQAAKNATALDPTYQPAHDLLAKLYVRAQQPKLAIEQAEEALAQDPNDEEALYEELMASRRSADRSKVEALSRRLQDVRSSNAARQQANDRYRLVEPAQH